MDIIRRFEPLFGVWHAESFIGAGSFGRVYKIYREEFGERFYSALKYISIPAESSDIMQLRMDGMDDRSISTYYTELTKGITAETRLMNKLRGNTNIVSFEDSKVSQKPDGMGYDIFIRMELLTGLPLRMVSSPLSAEETVKLGVDICNALIICKQHGIIHRDIKPDNIFISETGDYKLGDFGIARQLEKTATFMSKKGTYNYMAPEVYKGEKYGATCDLYSLGIVMYRLLNKGRLPFMPPSPQVITPDDRENAIVRRMKGESIPAPCDADEELAAIVLKACAFDPKDRFASAKEMKDALKRYGQKDHGIVPTLPVSDFDRVNDDADETQGVFGKSGDSQVPCETDPNVTSGMFAAPVKEANKSEDNADPEKTHRVFGVAAAITAVEPSAKEVIEDTPEIETESGDEHAERKPKKKRTGLIIGIAAAAVGVVFGALALAGVFGGKGGNDTVSFNETLVPTEAAAADAAETEAVPTETVMDTVAVTDTPAPTGFATDSTDAYELEAPSPSVAAIVTNTPKSTNTPKPTVDPNAEVHFADPNFESAFHSKYGTIHEADLLTFTDLDLRRCELKDISDVSRFKNLKSLYLQHNNISDLTPISGLSKLDVLHLHDNRISDITPLKKLTNIQTLFLYDNKVSDVSVLKNLTNMTVLVIDNNLVSNISSLENLTKLTWLSLEKNRIKDISPIAKMKRLTNLYLNSNDIYDISPLTGLTNLTVLRLPDNNVSDISPLAELNKLEELWLYGNPLTKKQILWLKQQLPNCTITFN